MIINFKNKICSYNAKPRNLQSPILRFGVYPPWFFRGTSSGRRRRKRRCRRMFSQSGARTADTDTFSRLNTKLFRLQQYVMIQNFKEATALSDSPWFEVGKWRCQEAHLPRGRRFTSAKKLNRNLQQQYCINSRNVKQICS